MGQISLNLRSSRRIETANYCFFRTGVLHPDRIMPFHDMVYMVQGEWEIRENNSTFLMKPGDVILLFAGRHHFGKTKCADRTRTLYIHFFPEEGDRFFDAAPPTRRTDSIIAFPSLTKCGANYQIRRLFEEIVHLSWSAIDTNRIMARIKLAELLASLSAMTQSDADSQTNAIDYVINTIERNPCGDFKLDELASKIRLSRRTLTKFFRQKTGMSVKQFQLNLKIEMAASLLKNSPYISVKEVASQFNFYDEFHFSRLFSRRFGVAPSKYPKTKVGRG